MKQNQKLVLKDSGVYFRVEDHTYWLGEKQLSGITGMLSRQLFPNKYGDVPEHVLRNAAERGSRIHGDCQAYDMFGIINSEEAQWYVDLKKEKGFEIIDNEYLVTDGELYASAIDKVGFMGEKKALFDVKTTYALDEKYLSWQLSIYKHLFEMQNDAAIDELYGIWIRNGKAQLIPIEIIPKEYIIDLLDKDASGGLFINPFSISLTPSQNEQALMLIGQVAEVAKKIDDLEQLKKEYNDSIEKLFAETGLTKWETESFIITKTKDYQKNTFDSKKFESEHPDLYKNYLKTSTVKGSIKTKLL